MRTKINYQINERNKNYEKNRDVLLAKSKLKQQKRSYERNMYKQQIKELTKMLEDITQAIEMLKTPISKKPQKLTKIFINEK